MSTRVKEFVMGISSAADNMVDKALISHRRKTEIKKMKDARRVKICEPIILSDRQKKDIDDFYMENYGEKIPYIWHRYFTAYTGNFDVSYFPELLFIPEFEYFINRNHSYQRVFADKNVTPMIASSVGVRMPKAFLSSIAGTYRNGNGELLSYQNAVNYLENIGEAFIKPTVDSSSGHGCAVVDVHNGIDKISGESLASIISRMGDNFTVQERVRCHQSIADIYPNSVNTFRIMTYRWKDQIEHVPLIMRIGQGGGFLDNAHAGGMFIAVEDDGTLHASAFTEFRAEYREHPDSHVVYKDYRISAVPELIKAAEALHSAIPQIGVINWDLTLDVNGKPMLIEANTFGGSIWLFQMAHGRGIFGDRTAEILQWMKVQKQLKKSRRNDENGFGQII